MDRGPEAGEAVKRRTILRSLLALPLAGAFPWGRKAEAVVPSPQYSPADVEPLLMPGEVVLPDPVRESLVKALREAQERKRQERERLEDVLSDGGWHHFAEIRGPKGEVRQWMDGVKLEGRYRSVMEMKWMGFSGFDGFDASAPLEPFKPLRRRRRLDPLLCEVEISQITIWENGSDCWVRRVGGEA